VSLVRRLGRRAPRQSRHPPRRGCRRCRAKRLHRWPGCRGTVRYARPRRPLDWTARRSRCRRPPTASRTLSSASSAPSWATSASPAPGHGSGAWPSLPGSPAASSGRARTSPRTRRAPSLTPWRPTGLRSSPRWTPRPTASPRPSRSPRLPPRRRRRRPSRPVGRRAGPGRRCRSDPRCGVAGV